MEPNYTEEMLASAVKNPYYHKLNKKVTVGLRNEVYDIYARIAEKNDEPIEKAIRRCLTVFSKNLTEAD